MVRVAAARTRVVLTHFPRSTQIDHRVTHVLGLAIPLRRIGEERHDHSSAAGDEGTQAGYMNKEWLNVHCFSTVGRVGKRLDGR